jgi:hypothetical protein
MYLQVPSSSMNNYKLSRRKGRGTEKYGRRI